MVDDCHATGFMGPKGRGHAGPCRGQGGHPDRHARQGAGRRDRRLHRRAAAGGRPAAAAGAALPVLQRAAAGGGRRGARGARTSWRRATTCARGCSRTPPTGATGLRAAGLRPAAGRAPDRAGDAGRGAAGAGDGGGACSRRGSTSRASSSRWCPKGKARIRTQMNAALTRDDLDEALGAFERAGRATGP